MGYTDSLPSCIVDRYLRIPSLVVCGVYILVLVILVRHRRTDFSAPFFKITTSLGVADVLAYLHFRFLSKFRYCNVIPIAPRWVYHEIAPRLVGTYILGSFFYGIVVQCLLVTVISLNRFTALVTPQQHESVSQ